MKASEERKWMVTVGLVGLLIGFGCGSLSGAPREAGPVVCRYGVFIGQDSAAAIAAVRLTNVPPPQQITTQAVPRFPGVLLCSELEAPPWSGS